MWSWLTLTWLHPLCSPPLPSLSLRRCLSLPERGRLPRTWFQFWAGSHFLALKFYFSWEDFFNSDLVLSAHFLDWCRIICFPCLVAMDYGLAAAMPYENNCQNCFSFMFMLSRIFVWGSLLFWLLPLTSMQVFAYQWSCNSECLPVEMFSYWKSCANRALSHNLPSFGL